MNSRRIKIGALIFGSGAILVAAFVSYVIFVRRQNLAHAVMLKEAWVSNRFQSIKPIRGKVLLAPAPTNKAWSVPMKLYVLSRSEEGYWTKPKLVDVGFKFGFFDGARYYSYEIMSLQSDGAELQSDYSGSPSSMVGGPLGTLKLRWK